MIQRGNTGVMSRQAMIILAHGSRNPRATRSFLGLIEKLRLDSKQDNIFGAFFSLGQPDLDQVVEHLAGNRIDKIYVFPYFLLDGSHVQKDIPGMIRALEHKYPGIEFHLLDSLEHEPLMHRILMNKVRKFL